MVRLYVGSIWGHVLTGVRVPTSLLLGGLLPPCGPVGGHSFRYRLLLRGRYRPALRLGEVERGDGGADAPRICSTSVNALISAWWRSISLWRSAMACAMSLMRLESSGPVREMSTSAEAAPAVPQVRRPDRRRGRRRRPRRCARPWPRPSQPEGIGENTASCGACHSRAPARRCRGARREDGAGIDRQEQARAAPAAAERPIRPDGQTPSRSSALCRPSTRRGAIICATPWPTPAPPSCSRRSATSTSTPGAPAAGGP